MSASHDFTPLSHQGVHSPLPEESSKEFQSFLGRQKKKTESYPLLAEDLTVKIGDPAAITQNERDQVLQNISDYSFSFYHWQPHDTAPQRGLGADQSELLFSQFAAQLGAIQRDDHLCAKNGISRIEPVEAPSPEGDLDPRSRFIPYSRRPIGPHTDGYYQARSIRSILLHCVRASTDSGENFFIDHELLFYLLYRQNPDWARALSAHDAFTVPEDDLPEGDPRRSSRARFTGPVFAFEKGGIFMRYSNRPKNILWKTDPVSVAALSGLKELIAEIRKPGSSLSRYLVSGRLEDGMGVVARNVIHGRSSFSGERMMLRIRSFDDIALP